MDVSRKQAAYEYTGAQGVFRKRAVHGRLFDLDDARLVVLAEAFAGHTSGVECDDLTVATCWDAERLDLARVGIEPDPALLLTDAARKPAVLEQARSRSEAWLARWKRT